MGRNTNTRRRANNTRPDLIDRNVTSIEWPLKAVGTLIDQMLDQLEALNITDPNLAAFNTQWTNYAKSNLNFDRA